MEAGRVGAVVLAAGLSSRFGGIKVLATLGGRPILQHVLDAVAASGVGETVVVLGTRAEEVERAIRWRNERRVRNPDPAAGLSSSLRVGIGALSPGVDAALIVLGDQPLVRPATIALLLPALATGERAAAVPRYDAGGGPNPVLLGRAAWPLVFETAGDRGLGPALRDHPDIVRDVPVAGTNPDVDTTGDLAALAWGERVRANREQVDRVREVADDPDFYAPLTRQFLADPRRTDDPILDQLLRLARPADTWLDIGAGAGRYALPIALGVREVIALDPSAGMLTALREQSASGGIANVRTVEARWPPDTLTEAAGIVADVSLIASVGHDIEAIGAFLDAMEAASRRLCVAAMSERQPSAVAEPFWPRIHDEERITLPSLPDLLELLHARGRRVDLTVVEQPLRGHPDEETLVEFVRRQLWIAPGGPKDRLLRELVHADLVERDGRVGLRGESPRRVGVVRWEPR